MKHFNIVKLTKITFSNVLKLLEDIIDLYHHNVTIEEEFSDTPVRKKALLLPHCSRKHMDQQCKAEFNVETSSYVCNHCSSDCLINRATRIGEKRGYDVYVLPGGSSIHKIINDNDYKGIIGVACPTEARMGREKLSNAEIYCKTIPLLRNGCSNTVFNLKTLEKVL